MATPPMPGPILDRMTAQVAAWDSAGDGRAVFLDCYAQMTLAVESAVAVDRFDDPVWVTRLMERFAEYYFVSIDGGDRNDPIPEPWVVAHAAAVGNDASTLQLLLAGVNAHINFDLVLTLVDVLVEEWEALDSSARRRRRSDYDEINEVIRETADRVQDDVLERRTPSLALIDPLFGRLDERVAVRVLTGWRRRVWSHAVALLDEPDPGRRSSRVAAIERQCARRSRWILV